MKKSKTNFDIYLEEKLKDRDFARRLKEAGEAWDVALRLADLRQRSGLSQKQLAKRLKTSQQQICRLESPAYEGHSFSMLRRVAQALNHSIHLDFKPTKNFKPVKAGSPISSKSRLAAMV